MSTVPLSGSNVFLLKGVPFTNDYQHSRWFDTKTGQTSYFTNKPRVHTMTNATFQPHENGAFVSVNKHIDSLRDTNYIMFQNENYSSKWFYAFVTRLEYANRSVTRVYFELDVFQTWLFEMDFKPSFIEREHRPLWDSDGSPVINTVPESLNYGTEYETKQVQQWKPFDHISTDPLLKPFFLVIVSKTSLIPGDNFEIGGDVNGQPSPLSFYFLPFYKTGTTPDVTVGSTSVNLTNPIPLLDYIYKSVKSVNDIVSIYVTDHTGILPTVSGGSLAYDNTQVWAGKLIDEANGPTCLAPLSINEYTNSFESMGEKYDGFDQPSESKLLMFPYCVTYLDDFKGNRAVIKNEYINGDNLNLECYGSMGTENKVAYVVENYNVEDSASDKLKSLSLLESGIINNNPNDVPIINDYLSAFLQGNKNALLTKTDEIMSKAKVGFAGSVLNGIAGVVGKNALGVGSSMLGGVQGANNALWAEKGIQAQIDDVENIPPNIQKLGSNNFFDMGNNISGVYVIKKQIKPEYRRKLTDFFNKYGYALHEVKTPNFHTRQYWNFVKTNGCVILGDFNQNDLTKLKSVFDNGITLWHTDDIGNYSLENGVI